MDVAERGVPNPEVVQSDPDAEVADLAESSRDVAYQGGLGDLDDQPVGIARRIAECGADLRYEVSALDLHGGNVDRDTDRVRPGLQLTARFLHHPGADRHDQSRLLGERNELGRSAQSVVGVLPAQQRLERIDAAVGGGHNRLEVQAQLRTIERTAQRRLHRESRLDERTGLGVVDLKAVPASALGACHRGPGVSQ